MRNIDKREQSTANTKEKKREMCGSNGSKPAIFSSSQSCCCSKFFFKPPSPMVSHELMSSTGPSESCSCDPGSSESCACNSGSSESRPCNFSFSESWVCYFSSSLRRAFCSMSCFGYPRRFSYVLSSLFSSAFD